MRIAVTGGSGFIGSNLVDGLLGAGHDVVVIDTVPPLRSDVTFRDVDVLDLPGLVGATRGCEALFHLAAISDVNDAAAHPIECLETNVLGTARVWEACRRSDVGHAVLASTVWVYSAAPGTGEVDEDAAFDPAAAGHVYTGSKISSELVVRNYHELYGQHFSILRYGIPYGPRMREALVIPRFLRMALEGRPITVDGDGSQYRNYVYIDDLVDGHLRALGPAGRDGVFNLEGTEAVSIRSIVESIRDVLDRNIAVEFGDVRPGDYRGRPVSAARADRVLGWRATTTFAEGLRRYVEWYLAETAPVAAGEG